MPLKSATSRSLEIQGGALFILRGYLDTENSAYFYRQISKFVTNGSLKLLLDCAALTYISSTGIGTIIRLHKDIRRQGGDMVLFKLTPKVLELFSIVGILNFINRRENLGAALRFFEDRGKVEKEIPFPKIFACPICGTVKAARAAVPLFDARPF